MPLLDAGRTVVLDRYVDSSLAYQGAGRGLGVGEIAALNAFATGGLTADLTFYLRLPPAVGAARLGGERDRLESAGEDFFARVVEAYDALAEAATDRYVVLDATLPPEDVLAEALKHLQSPGF
jgi:dTMP kinase